MTAHLEALHQRNFGGKRQILFSDGQPECEEAVYGSRNGHLYRRDGFYIYYQHRQVPEENDLWKKRGKGILPGNGCGRGRSQNRQCQ